MDPHHDSSVGMSPYSNSGADATIPMESYVQHQSQSQSQTQASYSNNNIPAESFSYEDTSALWDGLRGFRQDYVCKTPANLPLILALIHSPLFPCVSCFLFPCCDAQMDGRHLSVLFHFTGIDSIRPPGVEMKMKMTLPLFLSLDTPGQRETERGEDLQAVAIPLTSAKEDVSARVGGHGTLAPAPGECLKRSTFRPNSAQCS